MDITPYAEQLGQDLAAAAQAGGPEVVEAADRLAHALDPALRMVLLEALSHAAAEITQSMDGGAVEVRLKGREPQFVVTPPPVAPGPQASEPADEDLDREESDEAVARITLRIPESLKQRAEEFAAKRGQSLNAWLVNAVRSAAREHAIGIDIDLGSMPFGAGSTGRRRGGPGQHISGWVR
ncbi:MAG: toxin-antitoxin system HicB family antitoxin [Propionibacteriales bacterium]|nr:toxin-antitoxin system HicB family antitoxin [Propionibacteriales bacterium]